MATDIDALQIRINASAAGANKQLDKLTSNLSALKASLSGISAGSGDLTKLSASLGTFASAMTKLNSSANKTADYTRLTKNLNSLGNIDVSKVNTFARQLEVAAKHLSSLSSLNSSVQPMTELASAMGSLGSAKVSKATEQIPKLTSALNDMLNTLSRAPQVSQGTIDLVNAISNLASQGSKVKSATEAMSSAGASNLSSTLKSGVSEALSKTGTNLKKFGSSLKNTFNSIRGGVAKVKSFNLSLQSLAVTVGKLTAALWIVRRAFSAIGGAYEQATDFIETAHYWGATLETVQESWKGDYERWGADNAEAYAESFARELQDLTKDMTGYSFDVEGNLNYDGGGLGLDIDATADYQASVLALANSIGLCGESAVNMARGLSMIAADASSFRNVDLETAMQSLYSGMIGQSRALYKYGIDITQAGLAETALAYGIDKSVASMTQAEKAQLRYLAILEGFKNQGAWADLAATINTPANQLRVLQQRFKNLATTIGSLVLPIVAKVLPYVNALVSALQELVSWLAGILGIDMSEFSVGGSAVDSYADGIEDAVDATDDLTDATGKATDAAEKYKATIMGYDELNVMNEPDEDSGSSGGSSGVGGSGDLIDLSAEIADLTEQLQAAWDAQMKETEDLLAEFKQLVIDAFKSGDWKPVGTWISEGLTDALNSIPWANVFQAASTFGTGLATFLNGLITPDLFNAVGKTIANKWNTVIYTALAFGEEFEWNNLGNSIAAGINGYFLTYDFMALSNTLSTWLNGIFETLKTLANNIKWGEIATKISTSFTMFFQTTKWDDIGETIAIWANKLIEAISTFFGKETFGATPLKSVVTAIADMIAGFFNTFDWNDAAEAFNKFASDFWGALKSALDVFFKNHTLADILTGLFDFASGLDIGSISLIATAVTISLVNTSISIVGGIAKSVIVEAISGKIASALTSGNITASFSSASGLLLKFAGKLALVIASFTIGWKIGNFLAEKASGEDIDMGITEQIKEIINGFFGENKVEFDLMDFIEFSFGEDGFYKEWNDFWGDIGEWVYNYYHDEFGNNILLGLFEGLKDKIDDYYDWVADIIEKIVNWFKELLGIHSPSTVFKEIGENLILGLINGIKSKFKSIKKQWQKVKGLFDDIKAKITAVITTKVSEIKSKWKLLTKNIEDKVVEIKAQIKQKWSDLKSKWGNLTENIKDVTAEFKAKIGTKWSDIKASWEGLKSNIKDVTAEFKAKIDTKWGDLSNTWNSLKGNIKDVTATFKAKVGTTWNDIKGSYQTLANNFKDKTATFRAKVGTVWANIKGSYQTLANNFKDKTATFRAKVGTVWANISGAYQNLANNFRDKTATFRTVVGTVWSNISSRYYTLANNFRDKTANFRVSVGTVWNNIRGAYENLRNHFADKTATFRVAISAVASEAYNTIRYKINNFKQAHPKLASFLPTLPALATGGFPEDGLFMANHGELVGKFSNGKTAVANNAQIVEGIKYGVTEAMMNVYMATSGGSNTARNEDNRPVVLQMDGKTIARTTWGNLKEMSAMGQIELAF